MWVINTMEKITREISMEPLQMYMARKDRPKSNETYCGDITLTKRSADGRITVAVLSDTANVTGLIVRKLSESLDQALNRLLQSLESGKEIIESTAKFLDSYNSNLANKIAHATLVMLIIHRDTAWYLNYGDSGIAVFQRDMLEYFSPNVADGSRTVQYHLGSETKNEQHFYDELAGGAFESSRCTAGSRFILFSDGIHGCIRNLSTGNPNPLTQYLQKKNINITL